MAEKEEIERLAERLNHHAQDVCVCAAQELGYIAENEGDISAAVPALENNLDKFYSHSIFDECDEYTPAGLLTRYYVKKQEWSNLEKLLNNDNGDAVFFSVKELSFLAEDGFDITKILYAFGDFFDIDCIDATEEEHLLAEYAALALANAAEKGQDITSAVDAIEKGLLIENFEVLDYLGRALEEAIHHGYDVTSALDTLGCCLPFAAISKDSEAASTIAHTLHCAFENGWQITDDSLLFVLEERIDNDAYTGFVASELIVAHYTKLQDWQKLTELLYTLTNHERNFIEELSKSVKTLGSLEILSNFQKEIEDYFDYWLSRKPNSATKEKSDMKVHVSKLLSDISERKAELSKNGELLVGETIKPPRGVKSRKYQEIRRARNV